MEIEDVLSATPVIPVLVIDRPDDAVPLARAILAGGIRVIEVTLRTPSALDAVSAIRDAVPEAMLGVGTLTRPEHFFQAAEAGAEFAVSPGLTRVLLNASKEAGIAYLPGIFTPSEAMAARDMGFHHLKLFPAEQAGGIAMLKALADVFKDISFCPTGGIGPENFRDYLALPNVDSVGALWIAPESMIQAGDWDGITRLAREACS